MNHKFRPYLLIAIILLLIQPIYHTFKNHPYQYIYFNQLAGGVNGAYGNYEMDYYYHSLKESSEWLIENKLNQLEESEKLTVATNHHQIVNYYFRDHRDKVSVRYVRYYDRGNFNWDYAVIANSYINPYQQEHGYWPPANTIHEIKVNKAVVGAVIERKDKNDHLGYRAMKKKNYKEAEEHLKIALQADQNNEVARLNLAKIYIEQGRLDEANGIVNGTLKIYRNYDKALNLLGIIYMKKREFNNALGVFNRITQVNPKFVNAYHNIGVVFLNQQKNQQALDYFQQAIKTNPKYKPSYLAIAHILRQAGKEEEAQRYMQAANKL
jgi:tetratricopeptide (TPR) repeat protein